MLSRVRFNPNIEFSEPALFIRQRPIDQLLELFDFEGLKLEYL